MKRSIKSRDSHGDGARGRAGTGVGTRSSAFTKTSQGSRHGDRLPGDSVEVAPPPSPPAVSTPGCGAPAGSRALAGAAAEQKAGPGPEERRTANLLYAQRLGSKSGLRGRTEGGGAGGEAALGKSGRVAEPSPLGLQPDSL